MMHTAIKRPRSLSVSPSGLPPPLKVLPVPADSTGRDTSHTSKKLKLHTSFNLTSPFPDFLHPTPAEALEVHDLLCEEHNTHTPTRKAPVESSNSANTCGNVPNVIDSLIGTILSQNTSAKNSSAAKSRLDAAFGRNNFAAIATAARSDVVEAIKHGGLANKKAATIQNILTSIESKHGVYSLQHLTSPDISDDQVMQELISYEGVGPKTASCVLLFCLGRDSFAVDTHVFRLSKILGWIPDGADRVLAQAHMDLRIPGELKYGLHVLLIQHGRACKGCKKKGKGNCVLKEWSRSKKGFKEVVEA